MGLVGIFAIPCPGKQVSRRPRGRSHPSPAPIAKDGASTPLPVSIDPDMSCTPVPLFVSLLPGPFPASLRRQPCPLVPFLVSTPPTLLTPLPIPPPTPASLASCCCCSRFNRTGGLQQWQKRVRSSIPKGARGVWSRCLMMSLAEIIVHGDLRSWTDFLTLPALVPVASPSEGRRQAVRQENATRRRCLDWTSGIRAELWLRCPVLWTGRSNSPSPFDLRTLPWIRLSRASQLLCPRCSLARLRCSASGPPGPPDGRCGIGSSFAPPGGPRRRTVFLRLPPQRC